MPIRCSIEGYRIPGDGPKGLERGDDISPRPWLEPQRILADTMALEGVKVSPKVDLFSLVHADKGVNMGPRDDTCTFPWTPTW